MVRILGAVVAICICATGGQAATLNPDFSGGLNNWSFERGTFADGVITETTLLATVEGASDPYAVLKTPFRRSENFMKRMFQTVTVDASASLLRYDITQLRTEDDLTDDASSFGDIFLTGIRTSTTEFFLSRLRADDGLTEAVLQPLTGTGKITTTTAENSAFSHGVEVDLSDYIGQTIDVFFQAGRGFDGLITSYGVDNVRFLSTPPAVPVPASLPLLLVGFAGFAALRRKSANIS